MKEIALTRGHKTIVDDEDYEYLSKFKWYACNMQGRIYAVRCVYSSPDWKVTHIRMHREIMNVQGRHNLVDHIDRNTLNNTRSNLRKATHAQNLRNKIKSSKQQSSIYKGVHLYKDKKRFRAAITVDKKSIGLGVFDSEIEAAEKYNEAAIKYFKEFAYLNKIHYAG